MVTPNHKGYNKQFFIFYDCIFRNYVRPFNKTPVLRVSAQDAVGR